MDFPVLDQTTKNACLIAGAWIANTLLKPWAERYNLKMTKDQNTNEDAREKLQTYLEKRITDMSLEFKYQIDELNKKLDDCTAHHKESEQARLDLALALAKTEGRLSGLEEINIKRVQDAEKDKLLATGVMAAIKGDPQLLNKATQ